MNENKNTLAKIKGDDAIVTAIIKSKATKEQVDVIHICIEGLEGGLKIEKEHYENSKMCMEHLRTIHDGVLAMKEIASNVLKAWELTKGDRDFNPDAFKGGREGMQKALFYPMETFDETMPKIAEIFAFDEDKFLAPYIQNIRDMNDAISLFKKDIEIDEMIGELAKVDVNRRKAVLRKMFRAYKEYIGSAAGILHNKFKSPNVPEEQTDMIYKFVNQQVDNAKIMVEGLRKII